MGVKPPPSRLNQAVGDWPDINALAWPLVKRLMDQAQSLRVRVAHTSSGAALVDCGIQSVGGLEAGRLVTEICMGGVGSGGDSRLAAIQEMALVDYDYCDQSGFGLPGESICRMAVVAG